MEESIKRETSGNLEDLLLAVGMKLHNSVLQIASVVSFSGVFSNIDISSVFLLK